MNSRLTVLIRSLAAVFVTVLLLWLFWPLLVILAAAGIGFMLYMKYQAKKAEKQLRTYYEEEQDSVLRQVPSDRAQSVPESDIIDVEFTRKEPESERMKL